MVTVGGRRTDCRVPVPQSHPSSTHRYQLNDASYSALQCVSADACPIREKMESGHRLSQQVKQ
jgi:hypothetical protein